MIPPLTDPFTTTPIDPDVDLDEPGQRSELTAHPWVLPSIAAGGALGTAARYALEQLWSHSSPSCNTSLATTRTTNRRQPASCRPNGSISAASGAAPWSATTPTSGIKSLAELRTALAARVVHHGLHDLDAASIRATAPRAFTQDISRSAFEQAAAGQRRLTGLCYLSEHGDDLTNRAVFEPAARDVIDVAEFDRDDPDLLAALALHNLELE